MPHRVRIIAGQWRGSRLDFPGIAAIRPTPDRVRETLFNWLGERIVGARCLDLFAGSGALGLEALSRGASAVVFVDRETAVVRQIQASLERLGATAGTVVRADALRYLAREPAPFDVVFLDPPFGLGQLERAVELLETRGWLCDPAHVYVEAPHGETVPDWPAGWTPLRHGRAGQVGYHLVRRSCAGMPSSGDR
jgi:16S rRNA (guanine966-N2)-methyltransferase